MEKFQAGMVYSLSEEREYPYASCWLLIYEIFTCAARSARPLPFIASDLNISFIPGGQDYNLI